MHAKTTPSGARICQILLPLLFSVTFLLLPRIAAAQALTGALIGTVRDDQGGVLPGANVRVSSSALIGSLAELTTNEKGQLRFPLLPPDHMCWRSRSRALRRIAKRTSRSA